MDIDAEVAARQKAADQKLAQALEAIFKKGLAELTLEDKEFLYARRDMIGREKRDFYRQAFQEIEASRVEKARIEAAQLGQPAPAFDGQADPHAPVVEDQDVDDDDDEAQG